MKTLIHITSEKLDPQACLAAVSYPECGGIVSFVGTVRNQTKGKRVLKLEFEAYEKMALKEMQKIADQAKIEFQVEEVLIHHRTGLVKVGEEAVVIVVAAPHRKAAFQACEYCIDTLKETVPIWKKEFFEDGEVWVSAHP
ncbi:molybdopterin synthase subunit MoaE [Roseivirga ehrenbergii]|uniref:Molybdopterin synthase catalytic subunit n=1 Tax=Roseivirga ehrenbergii (strain DSM 102268 / JCM 13514 / KCTC 12282 / NCIMB 14502 / KMM 6017) TaxID=279360 RepID=A0A150X7F1_ROSEK|nr:molybdenum cofactor biosynthesis protein MoaE [Roseivirga ehrenbergii]KYG74659.1 molybdenum cofactor biosynthesis protein MoaE [Roseivirga ehrenbergii]TCL14018.1 molybdopterin synthase subunit MoaE [Roseivirga ehrenbergii]